MTTPTRRDLENFKLDIDTLADVVNEPADFGGDGLVHSRDGRDLKTLAKIESEIESTVEEEVLEVINDRLDSLGTLNVRGTWASTTAYTENDVVLFNGSSYIAIGDTTGNQPDATTPTVVPKPGVVTGTGTEADPHVISTYGEAFSIHDYINSHPQDPNARGVKAWFSIRDVGVGAYTIVLDSTPSGKDYDTELQTRTSSGTVQSRDSEAVDSTPHTLTVTADASTASVYFSVQDFSADSETDFTVTITAPDSIKQPPWRLFANPNPFTDADETKLDGIETGATADQTADEIITALENQSGDNRLAASAIKDLPEGSIETDDTLTGDGTSGSALSVANPFTDTDESKLDGIESGATADQTPAEIVAGLEGLTGNARLEASAIRGLSEGGILAVQTDDTLTGTGVDADRLSIANPFTTTDESKLDGIESEATADQTPAEIVAGLQGLTGDNRLDASAVKDLPSTINFEGEYSSTTDYAQNDIVIHDGTTYIAKQRTRGITPGERGYPAPDAITGTGTSADPVVISEYETAIDVFDFINKVPPQPNRNVSAFFTVRDLVPGDYTFVFDTTPSGRDYHTTLEILGSGVSQSRVNDLNNTPDTLTVTANSQTDTLIFSVQDQTLFDETGATITITPPSSLKNIAPWDVLANPNPFSAADETKLDGIEDNATADQTPAEIVTGLSGLTGNARLPASAVRDLPTGGGGSGLTAVISDDTLNGMGTSADPLAVANPFTTADKTKLDGIGADAGTAAGFNALGDPLTGVRTRFDYLVSDDSIRVDDDASYWLQVSNTDGITPTRDHTFIADGLPVRVQNANATGRGRKIIHDESLDLFIAQTRGGRMLIGGQMDSSTTVVQLYIATGGAKGDQGDGVPAGGTDGQIIRRTTTGYEWDDLPEGGGGSGITQVGVGTDPIYNVFTYTLDDEDVILQDDALYRLAIRFGSGANVKTFSVLFHGDELFTHADNPPHVQDTNGPGLVQIPEDERFAYTFGGRTWQFAKAHTGQLAWAWPDAPQAPDGTFSDDTTECGLEIIGVRGGASGTVQSDDTLTGDGSQGNPLEVANPFTAEDETKLDGIAEGAEVNVQPDWDATSGDAQILNKPTIPSIPSAATTAVDGLMSSADKTKLDGVEANATADQTASEITTLLEGQTGDDRLDASAIKGLSQGGGGLQTVSSDATLTGTGTDSDVLKVANPFSAADEAKLDGIESGATADQTPAEIVTGLSGLTGNARLPASAVRDLPSGSNLTDAQIGDKAFSNPPNNLSAAEKRAVIDALDAEGLYRGDWVRRTAYPKSAMVFSTGQFWRARVAIPDSSDAAPTNDPDRWTSVSFSLGIVATLPTYANNAAFDTDRDRYVIMRANQTLTGTRTGSGVAPYVADVVDARSTSEVTGAQITQLSVGDILRLDTWPTRYWARMIRAGGSGGGGLSAVASDATLTGDGTTGNTLKVANPFTATDESKLDGIEENATADQTPAEIVTGLTGLTGTARLPASAVRDIPASSATQLVGEGTDPIYNVFTYTLDDQTIILQDNTLYRLAVRYGTGANVDNFTVLFHGRDLPRHADAPPHVQDSNGPGIVQFTEAERFPVVHGGRTWQFARAHTGQLAWAWPDGTPTGQGTFGDLTTSCTLESLGTAGLPADTTGLTSVATDDTLTGDGTSSDTLKVANPIPDGGTAGQILARTASGYNWIDAPSGGGGGGVELVGRSDAFSLHTQGKNGDLVETRRTSLAVPNSGVADDDLLFFALTNDSDPEESTGGPVTGRQWRRLTNISPRSARPNEALIAAAERISIESPEAESADIWLGRTSTGQIFVGATNSRLSGNWRISVWKSGGGGTETPATSSWAQNGNTDKIPAAKLPATVPMSLGTDLPTPADSEFGKIYGIGVEEGTGDDERIEVQSVSYLKKRSANTATMHIGRLLGSAEAYGYSAEDDPDGNFLAGGAIAPEGVGPEIIEQFIVWRIPVQGVDQWFLRIIANVTANSPFSNRAAFRLQWRPVGGASWNSVTLQRQANQETEAVRVSYISSGLNANPWQEGNTIEVQFRSQTGTNVGVNLFTTDGFVGLVDQDNLENHSAVSDARIARQLAVIDGRISDIESLPRTLLGTWERSAASATSSTRNLTSAIANEQRDFASFTLASTGDLIQKRASESVYTAGGTNLVTITWPQQTTHTPDTGDNNQFSWRRDTTSFNFYLLRLTDLSDRIISEQISALEYRPNLLNEDHQPFSGVFIAKTEDRLTLKIGALVTTDSQRLQVYGLNL